MVISPTPPRRLILPLLIDNTQFGEQRRLAGRFQARCMGAVRVMIIRAEQSAHTAGFGLAIALGKARVRQPRDQAAQRAFGHW